MQVYAPGPQRTYWLGSFAFAVSIGLTAVSAARADTTDDLLARLTAKGILASSDYRKLKQRHASELARKEKPPQGAQGQTLSKDGVAIVLDGRYVTRLDKGVGVRIGTVDVKLSAT